MDARPSGWRRSGLASIAGHSIAVTSVSYCGCYTVHMLVAAISTTTILLIVLLVLALGLIPFGSSRGWGYAPGGGLLGLLLVVVLVMWLTGNLRL